MTARAKQAGRLARWCAWWTHVLDLALTAWVLRPLVAGMVLGFLLLWLVPQAQDLLVEMATDSVGRMLLFFALLVFVWALPTHYASRLLVRTDARYLERVAARDTVFIKGLKKWAPRVLGASTFVVMIGAVVRSWWNLPTVALPGYSANVALHLGVLAALLVILLVAFWIYAIHRHRLAATAVIRWAEAPAVVPMRLLARFLPAFTAASGSHRVGASDLGPFLLLLMFGVFALLPLCVPLVFAEWFPRASSVPFVLGGWMPLLVYLAGVGRRLRAPLITFAFALTGILPLFFADSYAVRRIDAAETVASLTGRPQPDPRTVAAAIGLQEAIGLWQQANGCAGAAGNCPRPIIVAAAGGASRAGFFTAGVIGQLLDDAMAVDGKRHGLPPAEVSKRLFALSTVSGSSVGAVMTVAALAASPDGRQSCRGSTALWWGKAIGGWRDCLEALNSGDFLTPVFAGFVFRDTLRFLGFLGWSDRATLLERSWERHFAALVGKRNPDPGGLACVGDLACPFMTLRPVPGRWLPLLVLNGTSVGTGQRIVTTALEWHYEPKDGKYCPDEPRGRPCGLFAGATMFHDLLRGKAAVKLNDVRLSTSADNSARFPLISPPGTILDSANEVVDRIVDGGYFENFGAQTATELAQAMRAIEPDLLPFILVLSNDPSVLVKDPFIMSRDMPPFTEGSFLTDISAPITAFANTRDARGTLAVHGAGATLDAVTQEVCNISHIRVWGEAVRGDPLKARALSMSWWLSKPIQIYLRQQTDAGLQEGNQSAMRDLLGALAGDPPRRALNASALKCSNSERGGPA